MGADGPREAVERIASLEHRDDASARVLSSDLGDECRQFGEVGVREGEPAERIAQHASRTRRKSSRALA